MLEPSVRPDPAIGYYRLANDYAVTVVGVEIIIPEGFIFDGASIPSAFWISFYTPYHPMVLKAGLVHDYIYRTHITSKEEADRLFNGLSAGGKVTMPIADMFWGSYYGQFIDKFGVQWMVSFDKAQGN